MIASSEIGRAFLLPCASDPTRSAGRVGNHFPSSLAAVRGSSGGGKIGSPRSLAAAASDSDQVDCLPDRSGAACDLSRGITARAVDDPARAFSLEVQMAGSKSRRGTKPRLADGMNFRRMWSTAVPLREIAELADMAPRSVTRLAKSYGYPYRDAQFALLGAMPATLAVDDPARNEPVEIVVKEQTHPRWPVEYDAAILKTDGKYSRIANLSKSLGRSVNAILGRWHQLRAM